MDEARQAALELLKEGRFTLEDLWLAFFGVGGDAGALELEAYIHGLMPVSMTDAELLSSALLELQGH